MYRNLLLLFLSLLAISAGAQVTPVDSFENWNISSYDDLDAPWITSNSETLPAYNMVSAKKVPGYLSNNAVRLETIVSGTDTMQGYIINTPGDPTLGEGGVPYSQKPTAITGYCRYNFQGNDSGILFVVFKKNGFPYSINFFRIKGTGSQPTFTPFSFPLNLGAITPDSVIIGAASGNILSGDGIRADSWLELDSLKFTGPGVTQAIPNGNFEGWQTISVEAPDKWIVSGDVSRSTDKYSGTYAAKLTTKDDGTGFPDPAYMQRTVGHTSTTTVDTLMGYYKYATTGLDSATVMVQGLYLGLPAGNAQVLTLPPAAGYTRFTIPFSISDTHDSIAVILFSNAFSIPGVIGSTFYVDQLQMSQGPAGVHDEEKTKATVAVYPNPAGNSITIKADRSLKNTNVSIINSLGQVAFQSAIYTESDKFHINLTSIPQGAYRLVLRDNNGNVVSTQPLIRQ